MTQHGAKTAKRRHIPSDMSIPPTYQELVSAMGEKSAKLLWDWIEELKREAQNARDDAWTNLETTRRIRSGRGI